MATVTEPANDQSGASVRIQTPVLLRHLESGAVELRSLADPALRTIAEVPTGAVTDFRLYLEAFLLRQPPHVVRRFLLPSEIEIRFVSIRVPRADLAREKGRDPLGVSVDLPVAVYREGSKQWAVVVPFAQRILVQKNEDLGEVVEAAAQRFAEALELDGNSWLEHLPSREHELRWVNVSLDHGAERDARTRQSERIERKRAYEILSSVADHRFLKDAPRGFSLVGREKELQALDALAGGKRRRGVLLVGETGAGKSAIFRGWLAQLEELHEERFVFATSGARLIAGMSGLGQWQERMRRVLAAAESLDALLLFEDLRDLFGDGRRGGTDLGSMLRTALDEGRIRIVGEITPDARDALARRFPPFFERMQTVAVPPLSREDAVEVLRRRQAQEDRVTKTRGERVQVDARAYEASVSLASRYLFDRALPGSAVQIYDEAKSAVLARPRTNNQRRLGSHDVYAGFSASRGMPLSLLREDEALRAESLRRSLTRRLIGQEEAVDRVVSVLCAVKARLQPTGKPLATLLFAGPTGVGKTEVARTVARELFGSEERLVRFDMSEYAAPGAAARLFGGDGGEGLLTRAVRQEPFRVILLDEIEKANAEVFDLLLQVAGEGRLTDARGRTASFQNAILVLTSNLGTRGNAIRGFGPSGEEAELRDEAVASRKILDAVLGHFRPEMVNRLDAIVPFHALGAREAEALLELALGALAARRPRTRLEPSDAARRHMIERGMDSRYGARSLRRYLEEQVLAPVASTLAVREIAGESEVVVTIQTEAEEEGPVPPDALRDGLRFAHEVIEPDAGRGEGERHASDAESVRAWRRKGTTLVRREVVRDFKEQLDYLGAATMARGRRPDRHDLAAYGRRAPIAQKMLAAERELAELEDLALMGAALPPARADAGADDMSFAALAAEGAETYGRLEDAVVDVIRLEHETAGAIVRLKEQDDNRTLDHWYRGDLVRGASLPEERVPNFAAFVAARGWSVEVCLWRPEHDALAKEGLVPPVSASWPVLRPFGPPLGLETIDMLVRRETRRRIELLLLLKGRDAALEMAIDEGLHRYELARGRSHLSVDVLAISTASLTDARWDRSVKRLPGELLDAKVVRLAPASVIRHEKKAKEADGEPAPGGGCWDAATRRAVLLGQAGQVDDERSLVAARPLDRLFAQWARAAQGGGS